VQYRFEEPVPCATDRSQATKRGQFQIVSDRPRRQAVCEWHAHRNLLFRPIVFLIRRLVFINIHLRLIEHDHYDFAEMKKISFMTCLILPGRTLADLAPRAARQLVSSVKSVAKHRKMEPATRTTPSLTRCSTLAAREKNVAMRRGRGAFWGGPRLCSGSSPFPVWNSLLTPHFQNAKSLDYGNPMVRDQLRDAIASCLLTARGAPVRGGRLWWPPVLTKVPGVKHSFRSCCPSARPRNEGSGLPL